MTNIKSYGHFEVIEIDDQERNVKNIEIRKKKSSIAGLVNSLLGESFGNRVYGDFCDFPRDTDRVPGTLGMIGKYSLLGFSISIIGSFEKKDGSKLSVSEEYEKKAIKYAELYRNATGKKVTIELY